MLMCILILVKFCPLVLKILSGNEMVTELRNNRIAKGQGKSALTFAKLLSQNIQMVITHKNFTHNYS